MEGGVLNPDQREQELINEARGPRDKKQNQEKNENANRQTFTKKGLRIAPIGLNKPLVMGFEFKSLAMLKGNGKAQKPGVGCLRAYVPSKLKDMNNFVQR